MLIEYAMLSWFCLQQEALDLVTAKMVLELQAFLELSVLAVEVEDLVELEDGVEGERVEVVMIWVCHPQESLRLPLKQHLPLRKMSSFWTWG